MRLLNVQTLLLESFDGSRVPEYAALSHTWGEEEVSFQDITTGAGRDKAGWTKILGAAAKTKQMDLEYIWVDTCCIDKSSSAELSEAINSMYRWYERCVYCLAYLNDVHPPPKKLIEVIEVDLQPVSHPPLEPCDSRVPPGFLEARWFKRGWTLQELLAPGEVIFYDSSWNNIGYKSGLSEEISGITGIDQITINSRKEINRRSIAQRMSWASKRETTRVEDIAYCLMGLFGINMPLLYGEGDKAFIRLQEEIIKREWDHTIFAWDDKFLPSVLKVDTLLLGVLAPHPCTFRNCSQIVSLSRNRTPYAATNIGLNISLPLLKTSLRGKPSSYFAILECKDLSDLKNIMGIPVRHLYFKEGIEFWRIANKNNRLYLLDMPASQKIYLQQTGYLFYGDISVR